LKDGITKCTEVQFKTIVPNWNQVLEFDLPRDPHSDLLQLSVWGRHKIGANTFIGRVDIPVTVCIEPSLLMNQTLQFREGSVFDRWYKLLPQGTSNKWDQAPGWIQIKLQYVFVPEAMSIATNVPGPSANFIATSASQSLPSTSAAYPPSLVQNPNPPIPYPAASANYGQPAAMQSQSQYASNILPQNNMNNPNNSVNTNNSQIQSNSNNNSNSNSRQGEPGTQTGTLYYQCPLCNQLFLPTIIQDHMKNCQQQRHMLQTQSASQVPQNMASSSTQQYASSQGMPSSSSQQDCPVGSAYPSMFSSAEPQENAFYESSNRSSEPQSSIGSNSSGVGGVGGGGFGAPPDSNSNDEQIQKYYEMMAAMMSNSDSNTR